MAERPRITGIILHAVLPDGSSRTYTLDPRTTEAIFFTDRAVEKMLGAFYEAEPEPKLVSVEHAVKHFGEDARRHFGDEKEKRLDKELVLNLWHTAKAHSPLAKPAFMVKTDNCHPTNG